VHRHAGGAIAVFEHVRDVGWKVVWHRRPGQRAQISHFIWSLKDGETCKFPDAFQAFVAATIYATAAEITAMPPRDPGACLEQ
jgi:hypothetical protein